MRYLFFACYIATIWGANWALSTFGFLEIAPGVIAGAGVFFAGAAFTFRDLLHQTAGRSWVIVAILAGAGLSSLLGATERIALASGLAFLLSESLDFAVYGPLVRRGFLKAVAASNCVGLVTDSALFLYVVFGSFAFLEGQIIGKLAVTALSLVILWPLRNAILSRYSSPALA